MEDGGRGRGRAARGEPAPPGRGAVHGDEGPARPWGRRLPGSRLGGGASGSGGGLRLAVLGLLGLLGLGLAPAGVGGQTGACGYDNFGSDYCHGLSYDGNYCRTDLMACQVRIEGGEREGTPTAYGADSHLHPPPPAPPLPPSPTIRLSPQNCCYSCQQNANQCWPRPPPPPPAAAPAPAPPAAPECRALVPGCPGYVAQGMCESDPLFMCDSCCATCRASGFCIPSPPPPPPPPPPAAQSVCTLAELRTALGDEYLRHISRITLTCHLTGLTEADAITINRGGTAGVQALEIEGRCGLSGQDPCEIVGDQNAPTIVAEGQSFNKGPLIRVTVDNACMPDKGDGRQGICTRDELGAMGGYLQVTFRNLVFKKGQGFSINGMLHVDFFNCDFIQLAKRLWGGAIMLGQMQYWQKPTSWYPDWSTTQGFPPRVRATYAQFTGNKAYLTSSE